MTTTHTVTVPRLPVDAGKLGFLRFGRLRDGVILTNEYGEWHHLDDAGFRALLAGQVDEDHPEREALAAKGFLRESADLQGLIQAMRRRKKFVGIGPAVHVIPLAAGGERLTVERAKDILDFAMLSTSSALELRLLAGDAAPDLDLLGFVVQYATEKNRYEGKALTWRLDVDPARLDDATTAWLIDKRFRVRAPFHGTTFDAATLARIGLLHEAASAKRREGWAVEVELVVDQGNVGALIGVADELHRHGIRRFRVRPVLHGEGAVALPAWGEAYRALLRHLLTLRATSDDAPVEEVAATLATRACRTDASADPEGRSPASGVVAYDLQGRIYPSPAAPDAPEPAMFAVGTAGETPYKEVMTHPTLRTLTLASLLECLPGFADHWATPYVGVDPVVSFVTSGNLFARLPDAVEVRAQLACVEAVFEVLVGDAEGADQLRRWAE